MRVFLPLAFCAVLLAGCGDKAADGTAPTATTGAGTAMTTTGMPPSAMAGAAGTYSMTQEGVTMSIVLKDDMSFEMLAPGSNGKGSYTHKDDKVVLTILETNGKPASEKDKSTPQTLTLSADGKLTGMGGLVLTKQ